MWFVWMRFRRQEVLIRDRDQGAHSSGDLAWPPSRGSQIPEPDHVWQAEALRLIQATTWCRVMTSLTSTDFLNNLWEWSKKRSKMISSPVSIVSAALDCGKYSHNLKCLHISLPRCTLFYPQTGEIALQRPNLFIFCSLSLVASVPKSRTTSMLSDGRLNGTRQRRSEQRSTDGSVEHSPKSCFCWPSQPRWQGLINNNLSRLV